MKNDPMARVRDAMAGSELARAVVSIKIDGGKAYALGEAPLRGLTTSEIERLEKLGNSSADWGRVRVAGTFDCRRVRNCQFEGDIVLGRFTRRVSIAPNVELPSGIERATLINCVIGNEVLIRDVKLLANMIVGEEAVLLDCGSITCAEATSFGNGQSLAVGIESGGREVPVFAEMDVDVAAAVSQERTSKGFLGAYAEEVARYSVQVQSDHGIIARGACVRATPAVRNSYIGPAAQIDGATLVADSTLLSNPEEPVNISTGACVSNSLVQWGTRVTTFAIVERLVLTEHSHVQEHARVSASIIGPNSGVARGELSSSLVGPFVNMHHASLVIATLWPEGRGNVSYGAMAGANHTSKAPDQEFRPGEGVFLGLGVKVRFPADLSRAPYTVFAAGVTTLPQKILFPFSLINVPSEAYPSVPPAYNEIFPAWMLTDNLYAIYRSESKFQARNQARRTVFDFRVLRPGIVDLMRQACRRLEAVDEPRHVYTDHEIAGLGKNYITEASRQRAIQGYQSSIRRYALLKMKEKVETVLCKGQRELLDRLLHEPDPEMEWEYARLILSRDPDIASVAAGLQLLSGVVDEVAQAVERSKAKDDKRGLRIFDDYADVHVEAAKEPIVRQAWENTRHLQKEITDLLGRLRLDTPPSSPLPDLAAKR